MLQENADLCIDSLAVRSADVPDYWSAYRLAAARSVRNCSAWARCRLRGLMSG
jgi:hypothetical protein